jgi:hypothetical protein
MTTYNTPNVRQSNISSSDSSQVDVGSYHSSVSISDWTANHGCRELRKRLNRADPGNVRRRMVGQKCLQIVCFIDSIKDTLISYSLYPVDLVGTHPKELT